MNIAICDGSRRRNKRIITFNAITLRSVQSPQSPFHIMARFDEEIGVEFDISRISRRVGVHKDILRIVVVISVERQTYFDRKIYQIVQTITKSFSRRVECDTCHVKGIWLLVGHVVNVYLMDDRPIDSLVW